jgi:glutathione peroxidase
MFEAIGTSMVLLAGGLLTGNFPPPAAGGARSIYEFTMKNIDGKDVSLRDYKGKVLLIVNVASKCGNTPQYAELETLFEKYRKEGFMILGFPANNFLGQEPGTDAEIKSFCATNYGVSFDLFSKISVKGKDQHPLYGYLTSAEANPGTEGDVTWNFQKYLIGRDGKIVAKFTPKTKPLSDEVLAAVEKALAAK